MSSAEYAGESRYPCTSSFLIFELKPALLQECRARAASTGGADAQRGAAAAGAFSGAAC